MIRSLLLAALAVLLAVPAMAQSNTVQFQYVGFFEAVDIEGLTALIYSDDPEAEPIERVLEFGGMVTLQDLPPGTYWPYLAPNDRAYTWYNQGIVVDAETTEYYEGVVVRDIDPALGFVQGRVTVAGSGNPVRHLNFSLPPGWTNGSNLAAIDGDGRFAFQPPSGSYDIALPFSYGFPIPEVEGMYRPAPATFSVAAGETVTLDLVTEVAENGQVAGRVTDAETGAPIESAFVRVYGADGFGFGFTDTDADGRYSVSVPSGSGYVVYADRVDETGAGYVRKYYDDVFFASQATLVPVVAGETTGDIDLTLSLPADDFSVSIQGTLSATDGTPLNGRATIYNATKGTSERPDIVDGVLDFTSTDPAYAGSTLYVGFFAIGYQPETYDNVYTSSLAEYFVTGPESASFSVGDVVLTEFGEIEPGPSISGTVTSEEGGVPLAGAIVTAQRLDAPGIRFAVSNSSGQYSLNGLDAGEYAVLFTEADHVPEFYPNAASWSGAERIELTGSRSGVDGLMGGLNRPVGANKNVGSLEVGQSVALSGAPFVQAGTLAGIVRDTDGAPIKGAVVTAAGPDGTEAYALSNSLGQISMTVVSSTVTVTADRGRYQPQSLNVAATGGGQLLLTLEASSAVAGEDAPEVNTALHVFPNPTRGTVTVAFDATSKTEVAVYDVLGRQVLSATAGAGAESVTLNTARLAPGRYVVRVLSDDRAESRPLTVVR